MTAPIQSDLTGKLSRLEVWYLERDARESARKMRNLREKGLSEELTMAICGHFSAGKSSLMNELCGSSVLPSGPLPTTANIAALRDGSPRMVLTPVNEADGESEKPLLAGSLESLDQALNEICRDGTKYERVSIWEDIPLLRQGGVLLDTPGVDSGEEAHALATKSALHLADVVFYVMDYNHVQSGSNLSFARSIAEWGKPLYLIINQIDKHQEAEQSFEHYRLSVEQAFSVWGISPAGIFYVSLKERDHLHNELSEFKELVAGLLERKEALLEFSIACSMQHEAQQFRRRLQEAAEEEHQELAALEGDEGETADQLRQKLKELELESSFGQGEPLEGTVRQKWIAELDRLLANSYLMTAELRESAEKYLEGRQTRGKSRFWPFRDKSNQERQRREEDLLGRLNEQVKAQLDWHVRDMLRKLGQAWELWTAEWEVRLEQELPQVEAFWLEAQAKDGAVLSGEYTLHYTSGLAAEITGRYRRAALALAEGLLAELAPRLAEEQAQVAARHAELAERVRAAERLEAQRAAASATSEQLDALLGAWTPLPAGLLPKAGAGGRRGVAALPRPAAQRQPQAPPPRAAGAARPAPTDPVGRQRLHAAAAQLAAAAEALAPYPAFGSGVRELRARAAQLREGRITLALFGAFSAGKSSFANALLGELVLPVSPHPTTAAITRIVAPPTGRAHKEACIAFKSAETMQADLAHSYEALQLGPWRANRWRGEVAGLKPKNIPAAGRPHYSFLKAAASQWEAHEGKLGTQQLSDMEGFAAYAAEEGKACFVESMDLYYSCPLTEQGLTIVDTPGADSIHARHTGVTFEYMKQCDALLYVTYYNHAFSRVDRQFLSHLGRVKGSFALDKMFFIVNAADLASSSEELDQVTGYVRGGLISAGVAEPQVFALSSKLARLAKEQGDASLLDTSGLAVFEQAFYAFINRQLSNLALESASRELLTVLAQAREWQLALDHSWGHREEKLARLQQDTEVVLAFTAKLSSEIRISELRQETAELLFHARNRLKLSAGDLFQEFFHPSLLSQESGPRATSFGASFHGWLSQLSIELERELQATSLRLEKKCETLMSSQIREGIEQLTQQLEEPPVFITEHRHRWDTPSLIKRRLEHSLKPAHYDSYFKNPKLFFEGGGRQKLRQALEQPFADVLQDVMEEAGQELVAYYAQGYSERLGEITTSIEAQWNEWMTGIQALSGDEAEVKGFLQSLEQVEFSSKALKNL